MSDSDNELFGDDDAVLEQRKAELAVKAAKPADPRPPKPSADEFPDDDAAFRAQFDRNHAAFHDGITTTVPLWGERVPQGMEDHANWRDLPEQAVEEVRADSFGPEFERIFTERQSLLNAKKAVSIVLPQVAALVTNQKNLADAPADDEAARALSQKLIDKNVRTRAALLAELQTYVDKYADTEWGADLKKLHTFASQDSYPDDQHPRFVEQSKKFVQRVFQTQYKMMQEMKAAKQAYLKAKSA